MFLDTQYRMHRAIATFPSDSFYRGELKTDVERAAPDFPWPDPSRPLAFLHVEGTEQRRGVAVVQRSNDYKIKGSFNPIQNRWK